jgi:ribose transport system permease protein
MTIALKDNVAKLKENRWVSILLPIAFLALICILFGVTTERFFKPVNLRVVFNQALIIAVVATGASFIFTTGNVNIAMGSCTALTATIAALVYTKTLSVPLMFCTAIAIGVVVMVICAILSTSFHVMVIYVTIVMMVLLTAIQAEILGGGSIIVPYAVNSVLQRANVSYIIFFLFIGMCIILFHFTAFGSSLKMVGSNPVSANLTGLFFNRYLIAAFALAGLGSGLGALMTIIRTGTINSSTASSMNMDVMLAIVLGGMPVFGGSKSKAYAATIGAITVTVLNNGLLMLGVTSTILQGVRGLIFLVLVLAGNKRSKLLPAREG